VWIDGLHLKFLPCLIDAIVKDEAFPAVDAVEVIQSFYAYEARAI
jgi:hypothetical protein